MEKSILEQFKEYLAFSKRYSEVEAKKNEHAGYKNFAWYYEGQVTICRDFENFLKELESKE